MQGYEPKADSRLRGAFKYFALGGVVAALGKLTLDLFWFPSSLGGLVVYWLALSSFALLGLAVAHNTWPEITARLRQRRARRGAS